MKGPPAPTSRRRDHGAAALLLTETTRMTRTAPYFPFRPAGAAGLVLLAAGLLLAPGAARAQLNPQELLKQVLPGAGQDQDPGDAAAAGERACQRYAEDQGLDVRRVLETRRSGNNNLEVTLSVEDRDDRYEARCVYDRGDREVRELEPVRGTTQARGRGGDDERSTSGWPGARRTRARSWRGTATWRMSISRACAPAAATRSRSRCAPGCAATAATSPASTTTTSARPCSPSRAGSVLEPAPRALARLVQDDHADGGGESRGTRGS